MSNEPTGEGESLADCTCDVLVIGSGAAAMACAVAAAEFGLNVMVAEKTPVFGGTSARSGGEMWIPGNLVGRSVDVRKDCDDAFEYIKACAGPCFDAARARAYVDNAARAVAFYSQTSAMSVGPLPDAIDYYPELPGSREGGRTLRTTSFDGRELREDFALLRDPLPAGQILGGLSVDREDLQHLRSVAKCWRSFLYTANLLLRHAWHRSLGLHRGARTTMGNAMAARLLLAARRRGVRLWSSASATSLIKNGPRVTGALLCRQGTIREIRARLGVVVATGGFSHDPNLTARHFPHRRRGAPHQSLTADGNAGDGLRMATDAGAALRAKVAHVAAWTPVSLWPRKRGTTTPVPHFGDRAMPGVIAVNQLGERFTNEAAPYHDFGAAMIGGRLGKTGIAYLVTDHRSQRRYGFGRTPAFPGRLGPYLRSEYLIRTTTVERLAAKLEIPAVTLRTTIDAFNTDAERGVDSQFRKGDHPFDRMSGDSNHGPNPCVAPLVTPPYYAIRLYPGDIGTFLGLATTPSGRVIDGAGGIIPGLLALGADAESVFGGSYAVAGGTLGPAITFALLAAEELKRTCR
jgi:glycine/D-amino acid oxidase-like deaminating enzyme